MNISKDWNWIWSSHEDCGKDIVRLFRHEFHLTENDRKQEILLQISADSRFDVMLNGVRLPINQFSDVPPNRTYSEIEISSYLKPDLNLLMVRVHYFGETFSTYSPGEAALAVKIVSGEHLLEETSDDWCWTVDPNYRSSLECKVTSQLSYVFEYDGRKSPEKWRKAVLLEGNAIPEKRPVPQLKELPRTSSTLVHAGWLRRTRTQGTFAQICASDYLRREELRTIFQLSQDQYLNQKPKLTPDGKNKLSFHPLNAGDDGYYVILDLGSESAGWISFDLCAGAGTVIDIAHGEHLDDGRVRASLGGRNFCDRYICGEGRNLFSHTLRRIGGRFIEFHITKVQGEVILNWAGIVPLTLPLSDAAEFKTDDTMEMRIRDVAVNTLALCMHEHYEDCIWREQALYPYDSRNQMLFGYYVWGNYKFAAASLDLFAKSYCGTGNLGLVAPSKGKEYLTIPIFTLVWITALYENYLYSGSLELFMNTNSVVTDILDKALARSDGHGMYAPDSGKHVWNFVEWTDGLSGVKELPQAPYNIYFVEALKAASSLFRAAGKKELAERYALAAENLEKRIEETFRMKDSYATLLPEQNRIVSEHIQCIMLAGNLVPDARRKMVADSIVLEKLSPLSFSALPYFVNALMNVNAESRLYAGKRLRHLFEPQILSGATSLWETEHGSDDFDFAGSLCHAWSSIHTYYSGRYTLGVTPLEPGFRKFQVKPYPGLFQRAEGSVPTPHGKIHIAWKREEDALILSVRHPAGTIPVIESWSEFPIVRQDISVI